MDCAFVTTELWIGPCPAVSADFQDLKLRGISVILSLQSEEDVEEEPGWEQAEARSAGIAFRNVPVTDFDALDLKIRLPLCVQVLDEMIRAGERVYLHCTAGVSRSPTVAAAYLHWCSNLPLEQALAQVTEARNCCPMGDVIRAAQWPVRSSD